uniref:Contactin 3a, tandem duplicate 1 n=1 Tax=Electrophorus electricus TaxID=8005 RepID=A0A4W4F1R6_ELEEL
TQIFWAPLVIFLFCDVSNSVPRKPVFIKQPGSIVFPLHPNDPSREVTFSCEAQGYPPPSYRWKINDTFISLRPGSRHSISGGNLRISQLNKDQDVGIYQCLASNSFGTILSREASLHIAYLEDFKTQRRSPVRVREGQGVVLLCGPPPHMGELTFSWIFNAYPSFVKQDRRLFVSQKTGNLYIAKVEPSDVGNYTCVVTNMVTKSTVHGPPTPLVLRSDGIMGEYEPKIEVQFPETMSVAKGLTVKLECFALGNPVPAISWKRVDGAPFPRKVDVSRASSVLEIPYFQQEDAGQYECVTENDRGKNAVKGKLSFYAPPHLVERPQDVQKAIDDSLVWECKAIGKPKPSYKWLKNGEPLDTFEDRIQVVNGALYISSLTLADTGLYQCVAENRHGRVFGNAELRPWQPDFSDSGGDVLIECRPRMSPRGMISWRKGKEALRESHRVSVLDNGTLRISNVTTLDAGLYTCVARNQYGVASSAGTLVVKEPTIITTKAAQLDVTIGESVVLPCQVSRDPSLDVRFTWFFNEQRIHFGSYGGYFEKVGGLMFAKITETTAFVSWNPGTDNHSPISTYAIQARTPFSLGWQAVKTVPGILGRSQLTARVTELSPWVEYEFRVLATNTIGTGEPSTPSKEIRTKDAPPRITPARVGGGGGSRSELVITWEPVPDELQSGPGFGYVVAFRPHGAQSWMQAAVTSPEASRYIFKNEREGPFGAVTTIYSAEEEPSRAPSRIRAKSLSSSEVELGWKPLPWTTSRRRIMGYELRYWAEREGQETARVLRTAGNGTSTVLRGLDANTAYHITLRAYNSAGVGPDSAVVSVTTRRPPPSQAPTKVTWNTTNSKIILKWDEVRALENESEVLGYKVIYKRSRHSHQRVVETNSTSLELSLPVDEDYTIQIKAISEGGESGSRLITIPRIAGLMGAAAHISFFSVLVTQLLSCTARTLL